MAKQKAKTVKIDSKTDLVAIHWRDHTGFKNMQLVPNSLTLTRLFTYGNLLLMKNDDGALELIQEREETAGGDLNDGCAIDLGCVKKIAVYRYVGDAELP